MKRFADLCEALDQSTGTAVKVDALADYFSDAPEADRIWTVALLSGRRPKRVATTTRLREWAIEAAGIPLWLFEDSHRVVGDLAETIAVILPPARTTPDRGLADWINEIRRHSQSEDPERKAFVLKAWHTLDPAQRFLFNKLITGGFRNVVTQKVMIRALARATARDEAELALRLMGDWGPATITWHGLIEAENPSATASRPYPFCLAPALDGDPENLGNPKDWQAEWNWNGVRTQLNLCDGRHFVWSVDNELMTDCFPELARALDFIPDGTVLDGELLVWKNGAPKSSDALQKRIGRKSVSRNVRQETSVVLYAYDILEWAGQDIRQTPLSDRRSKLEALCRDLPPDTPVRLSPTLAFDSWGALAATRVTGRAVGAEGLILRRKGSHYLTDSAWWTWTLDPLTINAVMIYAQLGHSAHAAQFTDFTFAVWNGDDLMPFAKACSGLTDEELHKITAWVRKNTQQRFGPVRQVTPAHVFEIAFDGIQASSRHKSGVTLRFPRMLRWDHDTHVSEANSLNDLNEMLKTYG